MIYLKSKLYVSNINPKNVYPSKTLSLLEFLCTKYINLSALLVFQSGAAFEHNIDLRQKAETLW